MYVHIHVDIHAVGISFVSSTTHQRGKSKLRRGGGRQVKIGCRGAFSPGKKEGLILAADFLP